MWLMPQLPRGRFLGHQFGKVRDPSGAFARLDLFPVYDGNAGGIVAAIFEPPQTVQKYGRRFCAADISDNSTHNFRRGIIAYFSPLCALRSGSSPERAMRGISPKGQTAVANSRDAFVRLHIRRCALREMSRPSARSLAAFAARDDDAVGGFSERKNFASSESRLWPH